MPISKYGKNLIWKNPFSNENNGTRGGKIQKPFENLKYKFASHQTVAGHLTTNSLHFAKRNHSNSYFLICSQPNFYHFNYNKRHSFLEFVFFIFILFANTVHLDFIRRPKFPLLKYVSTFFHKPRKIYETNENKTAVHCCHFLVT